MPKLMQQYGNLIREYQQKMRNRNLNARYIHEAGAIIRQCAETLEAAGQLALPPKLKPEVLTIIRDSIPIGRNGNQRYRQFITNTFRTFANKTGGNLEPLNWPQQIPHRPRITEDTYASIREAAYRAGDITGAALLLYFGLTARRGAALKAVPEDIQPSQVLLRDKGRGGEKQRQVPIRPQEYAEFQQYMGWRQQEIMRVLANNPKAKIPDRLFIWAKKRTMGNMAKTGMDTLVHKCGRRAGVHLTSHMIRRMASRELYLACEATGEPIQTAMAITGHVQTDTFLIYVGALDQQKADLMAVVYQQREQQIIRKRVISP